MENRLQRLSTQKTENNFNTDHTPLQKLHHTGQEKAIYLSKKKNKTKNKTKQKTPPQTMDLKRNQEGNESRGKFQGNFT